MFNLHYFNKTFQVTKKLICSLKCLEGKITQAAKSEKVALCLMRVSMNEKEPEQERNVNNLSSRVNTRNTDIFPNQEKDEFDRLLKKVFFFAVSNV